jgi:hypothetical protein
MKISDKSTLVGNGKKNKIVYILIWLSKVNRFLIEVGAFGELMQKNLWILMVDCF